MMLVFLLLVLTSSVLAEEVCYEPCGCHSDAPPFDDRPLPESPEDQQIVWLLYTLSNTDIPVEIHWDSIPAEYQPGKPTKFLVHGWTSSPDDSGSDDPFYPTMTEMKNALLSKYDYNVIVVDWSVGADHSFYPQSASNIRVVGSCSGYLASVITDLSDVHCIGHSLGGQTCGYMGKFVNGSMGRATGMDPAGPWFDTDEDQVRLDASDAEFVDIHHTNVEGLSMGLGRPVGHVDFYPHKGGTQPPCNGSLGNSCDHGICKGYYYASITEDEDTCTFESYPCGSNEDADAGLCMTCTDGVDCQSMGYHANQYPGRGTFYTEVNAAYPYCRN